MSTRHRKLISFPSLLSLFLLPSAAAALSTTTLLTLNETQSTSRFGYSVAAIGDVNGDGFGDVLVGAPLHDAIYPDDGAAYVYFGGNPPNAGPDMTLTGTQTSEAFGYSVAGVGDVNGDGYPDFAVGAVGYSLGQQTSEGKVYVYFGGPNILDSTPDWTIVGAASEGIGTSLNSAGDVNRDGKSDIVFGTYNQTKAYVYFGGNPPNTVPHMTLSNDNFWSVSGAGDFNGDTYGDVIAGAYGTDHAYVFYGSGTPNTMPSPDLTLSGQATGDDFGWSVSSADVNGDGKGDLIVGAPFNDGGGLNAGRAYVYYGSPTPDNSADVTLTGAAVGDWLGWSVSSAGDVNADGITDVIVGANRNDVGGSNAGQAYVYFGGASGMDNVVDLTMTGNVVEGHFGGSVSGGDVNNDGHADLIVGAENTPFSAADHAYVFSLILPDPNQSFYVPQRSSVTSPIEGAGAISRFYMCPNNDLSNTSARIKFIVKDSAGNPITGIAASDMNLRFNGGTTAQGFSGPYADSIIANSQYNPAFSCPDVRRIDADAGDDATGIAYLTFRGASPSNPGVELRDPNRKWGHYDSKIPVYVLGVELQGKMTSDPASAPYVLQIKSMDFEQGLTTMLNQGEWVNSIDSNSFSAHINQPDSADPKNWWRDFNSDGNVNTLDNNIFSRHVNHKCDYPLNP